MLSLGHREKGNKAQALKLLKAVQDRLAKGGDGASGALAGLGGANDLVRVAPKVCIQCSGSYSWKRSLPLTPKRGWGENELHIYFSSVSVGK